MTEAGSPAALRSWLSRDVRDFADKTFIHGIDQDKAISYGQAADVIGRLAAYLGAAGLQANDRVALLSSNSIEHLLIYLGVMAYGATICTIHVEMNAAHVSDILGALEPKLVLYEAGFSVKSAPGEWRALGEWRPDGGTGLFAALEAQPGGAAEPCRAGRNDDACIYFTSGTSAKPKGVVLSFGELLDNVEPIAERFGMTAEDRMLDFRSFNWASAQILSGLAPLAVGATLIMARKFSQSRFFGWIAEHGATIAAGNPTTIAMLLNRAAAAPNLPSLRFITSSSAPLPAVQAARFEDRFGIPIGQGYGSSETGWIAGSNETTRRPGSVGKPLKYLDLKIVDDDGRSLPAGETGLVELGNEPARAYRYLDDQGAVQVNARGRIRTGDLGYLDDDGYLSLTGREKDLIIRGGVNISPAEIDAVLMAHAEVAEAATIGVPDPIYGEAILSFVVVKPGSSTDEETLRTHCRGRLSEAKRPKSIVFLEDLPKTERGKLDRKALREQWRETDADGNTV
jgi:acyl-coenzyme A synthetase/AMP-(fatty) acid ligase